MASLKEKIAELNLLIELDINNQSYQEVEDKLIKDIDQLDETIVGLQDDVTHLNKVAKVFINLDNADSESRRLTRYDYVKMNLTASINRSQFEQDI